ncbi:MAG: hypothetical protein N3G78_04155 [Desulfobacterota bacterium]|nr:hypothetical protein [Thermodesulfobacteriota bacterium]
MKSTLVLFLLLSGPLGLGDSFSPRDPTVKELIATPERITVGGKDLSVEAYLWRDFMPISPPGGRPLMASIRLKTVDGTLLPKGLKVARIWLVKGEEVWIPAKKEVIREDGPPSLLNITLRDGPKWGPGLHVEVVLELRDDQNRSHLIRASRQPIHRTD